MARMFLVVGGVVLLLGSAAPADAVGEEQRGSPQPVPEGPAAATGELAGVVTAADGAPVGDVLVSLSGPGGSSLAVSDSAGRFRFDALPVGRYLIRTHATGGDRRFVQVTPGEALLEPLVLGGSTESSGELQLAGGALQFGIVPLARIPADDETVPPRGEPGDAAAGVAPTPDESDSDPRTAAGALQQDAKMWRLRRARRSVLKDHMTGGALVQPGGARAPGSNEGRSIAERWAAAGHAALQRPLAGLPGLPISGEVQFLTRATLTGPKFFWPSDTWPGQVAYVSVAPSGAGDWALRGTVDMTTGETSSWAVAGWYAAEPSNDHDLRVAISYSRQAPKPPPRAILHAVVVACGRRACAKCQPPLRRDPLGPLGPRDLVRESAPAEGSRPPRRARHLDRFGPREQAERARRAVPWFGAYGRGAVEQRMAERGTLGTVAFAQAQCTHVCGSQPAGETVGGGRRSRDRAVLCGASGQVCPR